jgi:hypothetical protein
MSGAFWKLTCSYLVGGRSFTNPTLGNSSSGYLLLNGGKRQWYKHNMRAMGELGRRGLPCAIPAEELRIMLGNSEAFCSWDASNSTVNELMDRWPFLFSHPFPPTNKKPKTK